MAFLGGLYLSIYIYRERGGGGGGYMYVNIMVTLGSRTEAIPEQEVRQPPPTPPPTLYHCTTAYIIFTVTPPLLHSPHTLPVPPVCRCCCFAQQMDPIVHESNNSSWHRLRSSGILKFAWSTARHNHCLPAVRTYCGMRVYWGKEVGGGGGGTERERQTHTRTQRNGTGRDREREDGGWGGGSRKRGSGERERDRQSRQSAKQKERERKGAGVEKWERDRDRELTGWLNRSPSQDKIIVIIKRISWALIYRARWEYRALYNNTNYKLQVQQLTHTHTHTRASDEEIGTAEKSSFEIVLKLVCREGGFQSRIRDRFLTPNIV